MGSREFPEVPQQFRVTTGDEAAIEEQTDLFFLSIIDYLGINPLHPQTLTERREVTLGLEHGDRLDPTNDQLSMLITGDHLLATVLRRRTDFNHIEVSFAMFLDMFLATQLRREDQSS